MDKQKKGELLDQFDETAFAILMDEYAEAEGARLWQEFETAAAAGEVPEIPESLDEACLQMIHRSFSKQERKRKLHLAVKTSAKAAVTVLVFLGIVTATILSVDALRTPVLNFLITHTETASIIDFNGGSQTQMAEGGVPMELIPDGYTEVYNDVIDGLPSWTYADGQGNVILFDISPSAGKLAFDSEDAIVEEIIFEEYTAFYIREDRKLQLIWFDDINKITYNCCTEGFKEKDFFALCTDLLNYYDEVGKNYGETHS